MKTQIRVQSTLVGVWHNQHNSEMHLEIDESGKIVGSFINGVSSREQESESFPLTGFARGDVFSFCVDFSKYGCMTTWVGQIVDEGSKKFQAHWQMIADAHQRQELAWKSIWVGQDEFEFGPRATPVSTAKSPASHPLYCSIV